MNKLDNFIKSEAQLTLYVQGMSLLFQSGIFDVLKEKGLPRIIGYGENVQVLATQAARSAGYNEALEDLLYFKEKYLDTKVSSNLPKPEYGGVDRALSKGDLEEKELNVIRNGNSIDYNAIRESVLAAANKPTAK